MLLVVGALAITCITCNASVALDDESPPNIIVIVSDNQGSADFGFRGSKIQTPQIDRLAQGGILLDQHYVFAHCSPTRAGLLLGRNPSRYGILGAIGRRSRQSIPLDSVTLASSLSERGYATAIIGKWHLGLRPEVGPKQFGFDYSYGCLHGQIDPVNHLYKNGDRTWHRNDEFIDQQGHVTDLIAEEAIGIIERWKDRPYFLYVPFNAPHGPYVEDERWTSRYAQTFEHDSRRLYAASITHMDHSIGRLLDAIERTGQLKRTLVVFFSDNGGVPEKSASTDYGGRYGPYPQLADNSPLRGWFGEVYEGALRVPTIVYWPGHLQPKTIGDVTSVLDWYPTLVHLAQGAPLKPGLNLEGRNIWPLLSDGHHLAPPELYWRTSKQVAFRNGDLKLVVGLRQGDLELFNLKIDPFEKRNVASEFPGKVDELLKRLKQQQLLDLSPAEIPVNLSAVLRPLPPRKPREAEASFEVVDGFRMELVAHEPLVTDPVAACFDENGRMYIAEMRGYPYRPPQGVKPMGRIRLLIDTDGDGTFDASHVFADELLWPSGVVSWKQGVFVAAAPDIWYLKDTDGDFKADVRRRIYTGFGTEKSQGSLNNLIM